MGFKKFLSGFKRGDKKGLESSISAFCEDIEKGKKIEENILNLRNSKWHLMKGDEKKRGIVDIALKIDEEFPGFVPRHKRKDINDLIHFIRLLIKINNGLELLFKKESIFGEREIKRLSEISKKITEEEQELISYYRNNVHRIGLDDASKRLLQKAGELAGKEEQEKKEIIKVISVIKSFDETAEIFKNAISKQLEECNEILGDLERIKGALKGKGEEGKEDVKRIKAGIKNIVDEFRNELEFYKRFEREEHFRDFVIGELGKEEKERETTSKELDFLKKEKKLRVLIIPCCWGFGPVSKGISLINSIHDIDSVIDEVGVVAAPEFCDFAKRAHNKIRTYELSKDEQYDRHTVTPAVVSKFIKKLKGIFEEFKPNLVIDSLGYLGAIIAKTRGIKVIKIDHLFPELSKKEDAQKIGIQFFNAYKKLGSQMSLSEFENLLIKYANIRAFQWLGDVIADYLIVPYFYQINITPSVLQYRGNKNIFFVNPCMNKQARLLMDDIFGVKKRIESVLRRCRRHFKIKSEFTKTIVINTGGISTELPKSWWTKYFNAITGVAKAISFINSEFEEKGIKERIGIVLIGALGKSREFKEYMGKNWNKSMKWVTAIPGNLRQYNTIRLFLSADAVITNAGQTSISELLTLNKPFLVLPHLQVEQYRNVNSVIKSGIGIVLQNFFDSSWNAKTNFRGTILDLINPKSRLNYDIRNKQMRVFKSLKEINGALALIVSQILGFKVYISPGSYDIEPEEELSRYEYEEPVPWTKKFSVVIPIMDKDPNFLENCIRSFRKAEPSPTNVEIIVVDFESKPSLVLEYKKICQKYNAIIHSIPKRGKLYNPSLLKNYGVRKATGEYVILCDVDCVSTSNVFYELKKTFLKYPKAYVVGRVYLDRVKRPQRFFNELSDEKLRDMVVKEKLEFRPRSFGGFVAVDREWFSESGGFDESYIYWGAEDDDFRFRSVFIKKKKLVFLDHIGYTSWSETTKFSTVNILYPTDVVLLHQWHSKRAQTEDKRLQKIIKLNQERYKNLRTERRATYKNSVNWGTNKVKILIITPNLLVGGVERILVHQCNALVKNGFDVKVLISRGGSSSRVDHMMYKVLKGTGADIIIPKGYVKSDQVGLLCSNEILDFKPEIVFITNESAAPQHIERLKNIFREMKVVYMVRSTNDWSLRTAAKHSFSDILIATYPRLGKMLEKLADKSKIKILENPIDKKWFNVNPSNNKTICASARISSEKCFVSFVDIISEIQKEIHDVKGIIMGGPTITKPQDKEAYSMVTSRIKKLKAPVEITGFVENVEDYLSKSKVFLLTSGFEGWCNSIWEGIAAGLIPVSTQVGSLIDALKNTKHGYLCSIPIKGEPLNELPEEMEHDLAKKCVEALKSKPDVKAIKKMAMPYHVDIWRKRFVDMMLELVGKKK